ncbi:MAG TPA: glycosyltransferase, partial [Candidatus Caccomorpha excrementavium]|nr:glycosyltransferase [Candidatus Caccomorpha excrementavium]
MINFDIQPQKPVKVSVVVPVCNVEQYLRECLDSIMGQTLREIEIICVNDGSSDSCMDILREYAQADTRIKVINKVNAGYGHTMNLGIDMAQGEYIGIVESDDFVVPEMYQELYDIATAHDLDL